MAHKFKPTTTTTKGNIDLMRKSSNSKLKKQYISINQIRAIKLLFIFKAIIFGFV